MADISDVETALVGLIVAALYPTPPANSNTPSIAGPVCEVYRGWPNPNGIDPDMKAGRVNVSVFPKSGMTRDCTRWLREWETLSTVTPTLMASVSGLRITFAGTCAAGQLVGIVSQGVGYAYSVKASDTPASVAAAFAAAIAMSSASGAVLTLPSGGPDPAVRIMQNGQALLELRRQEQGFVASVWAPDPTSRDAVAKVVDAAIAAIPDAGGLPGGRFFALADGTEAGPIRYGRSDSIDTAENANLYRRDLTYRVEYATTLIQTQPQVLFGTAVTTINNVATVRMGDNIPSAT